MPFRRLLVSLVITSAVAALLVGPKPARAEARTLEMPSEWIEQFDWRSLGPANMGGRIVDLAVYEADPNIWWAATASGGLVKTTNNGITFTHQFDHQRTVSLGAVAVAQGDPNIVWVGTGEANPRNSVSWGNGVYKSTDGGASWQHMGLDRTFQIGRVAIHPTNPDIVYVAALGRLWGTNPERGLFKTTDGGKTWNKVLYIDERTGAVDVQMHPTDPDTLLVATYERQRDGFDTNDPAKKWGPGGGLHRTTDGGHTWQRLTRGLPTGDLGRIGISYYRKDPSIVYVVLECERIAQEPDDAAFLGVNSEDAQVGARLTTIAADSPAQQAGLERGDIVLAVNGRTVHSNEDFLDEIRQRSAGDLLEFEVSRDRASVYVEVVLGHRPPAPKRGGQEPPFSAGLGGQRENAQLQQGPAGHEYGGVYRSTNGGDSWTRINSLNPRPMYFSQIRVDPSDNNHIYVLGIELYRSSDGGQTFTSDGHGHDVHVDHHAMWVDPRDGRHILLGNDGGLYYTYDRMAHWEQLNRCALGQFYHVAVGPRRDYRVYGGLQDNGTWAGPAHVRTAPGPRNEDWHLISWADGFICRVDALDPDRVYYEMQFGGIGWYNQRTVQRGHVRPPRSGRQQYRFNWQTPYILSHHNPRILYAAANYVFRSVDGGDALQCISPEITRTKRGSATALAESPHDPDVLYVGTDDGALWRTLDGGHDWTKLTDFPETASEEQDGGVGGWLARVAKKATEQVTQALAELPPPAAEAPAPPPASATTESAAADPNPEPPAAAPAEPPPAVSAEPQPAEAPAPPTPPDEKPAPAEPPTDAAEEPASDTEASAELEPEPEPEAAPLPTQPLLGPWDLVATLPDMPAGTLEITLTFEQAGADTVQATYQSQMGSDTTDHLAFDPATGELRITFDQGVVPILVTGRLRGDQLTGLIDVQHGKHVADFTGQRAEDEPETGETRPAAQPTDAKTKPPTPPPAHDGTARPLSDWVPGPRWVSSLEASRHDPKRLYVTLDGHRSDDDEPYVFVSQDQGRTFTPLRANLPTWAGTTRVLREDLVNPDLLYLGAEFGLWVSLDRGKHWQRFHHNLPTVAIHEIAQHPTSGDVVVATHGRSLWTVDVTALRHLRAGVFDDEPHLLPVSEAVLWRDEIGRGTTGSHAFTGDQKPLGVGIYYLPGGAVEQLELEVVDFRGITVRRFDASIEPGLQRVFWDLRREAPHRRGRRHRQGPLVEPGDYLVRLQINGQTLTQPVHVLPDPRDVEVP